MDNQRLLIWAFFGLMAWITYQTWVQDYGPKPAPTVAEQAVEPGEEPGIDASLPEISDPGESSAAPLAPDEPARTAVEQRAPAVRVKTDVLDIEISTQGGTLQKAVLLRYPVAKDQPDTLVELLSTRPGETGLLEWLFVV